MVSLVVSKQLRREGSDIVSEARACQESPGTRHSSDAKARVGRLVDGGGGSAVRGDAGGKKQSGPRGPVPLGRAT